MTKKLFVVLVVVSAMLISFSLVMGARKAKETVDAQRFELPQFTHQQSATSIPQPAAIQKKASINEETGRAQKGAISHTRVSGTLVRQGAPSGKDLCNLAGTAAWFVGDWIYGLEWYANYQDPAEHGCTAVWPFKVSEIDFQLNFPPEWVEANVSLQGFILANVGTPSCPEPGAYPGDVICSTSVNTFDVPAGGGYFEFPILLTEECCVYGPYFAAVYVGTDVSTLNVDMVAEDNATAYCRSYNDYGGGWVDLVQAIGFPGPIMLYSQGYTHPQNTCPAPPDTCYVNSVVPPSVTVLAGGTANYTANVSFSGYQTSCNLTVTPDPACPSCVTTITPNPVVSPLTSATVTIQTSASTTPGTYTFSVNGAKTSATLIVLAHNDNCEIERYITGTGYYFGGWSAGDQNAILLDPATCIACGADVYPFQITQIKSRWVNSSGLATALDVIFHIYEAPTPYCNGPGAEIYQFPAHITAWSPNYVTVNVPTNLCVHGPFWLAAEYVDVVPPGVFPSLRMSSQTYADTCTQFNYYQGSWYEWADFWSPPPPGYFYMAAIGNCTGSNSCPITCDMAQDNGHAAGYASWIMAGFQVAKYYNPEDYCQAPVYPYAISDVEFPLYNFGGVPSANMQIGIYLAGQDSCFGPASQIYLSNNYNITTFYPSWVSIALPETVCVHGPFFVSLIWNAGPTPMPSMLMDNNYGLPGDSCHQWYWYPGYSPPWIEHHDLWGSPENVGTTMLRVTGFTNSPECVQEPCTTSAQTLSYYMSAAYIWALPSTSNRNYPNERFTVPATMVAGARLDEVHFAWYNLTGDPDPTIYVWSDDGTGLPYDPNPPNYALASWNVTGVVQTFPNWHVQSTWQTGLHFNAQEEFHVGYSFVFDPGDKLDLLSDDYTDTSNHGDRASWYWPTGVWENSVTHYSSYMNWLIEAVLCPIPPGESTFVMTCAPPMGLASPGDVNKHVFDVTTAQIMNYPVPITLSLLSVTPPVNITANFVPNGVNPPFVSAVNVNVDPSVTYGDYILTFQAVGGDGQTKTCDVTLRVQPPYDEQTVNFYHGLQRTSNFGAVGNDAKDNFVWYGSNYLFDGTFISAFPTMPHAEHMALDVYNCAHMGFEPTQYIVKTHQPWCPGAGMYEENYGEVAYSQFFTPEDVGSTEWDSLFVIGLSDVQSTDFSIKIKIYYNPSPDTLLPLVNIALFEDWDVGDAYNDWADMDTLHNIIYEYDPVTPTNVFGMFKAPFYDDKMLNMVAVRNPVYVWPGSGFCGSAAPWALDSLYLLMTRPGYTYPSGPDTDFSLLMSPPPISLNPGEKHIEIWFDFGRNTADGFTWSQWYHKLLRYAGFYRGDVNASDTLELPSMDVSDLVYLINYLFLGGPAPQPFIDQGNVDGKGPYGGPLDLVCPKNNVDVQDLVYMVNYVFKGGPPPIDYVRFIKQYWSRPSLFTNPLWK